MRIRTYTQFSICLLALFVFCGSVPAFAQDDEQEGSDFGQQRGIVTDQNGKALAGVEVSNGSETVTTNEKGEFTFRRLRPRVYTFTFKKDGFQPASVRKEVAAIFNNRPIEVKLAPAGGQQAAEGPIDVQAIFQEGSQLLQSGDFAGALQKFQAIKVAAPNQPVADAYIGLSLMQLGRYAEALEALKVALAAMPDQPMVVTLIADAYLYTDQPGEALVYYEKLIELNIADAQTYLNMGIALHNQGQKADALLAFAKATELQPDLGDAWLRYGAALLDESRWAESIPALEQYLALDPNGVSAGMVKAQLAKACLEQAILMINGGQGPEALPFLEKVVAYAPDSEEANNAKALMGGIKK